MVFHCAHRSVSGQLYTFLTFLCSQSFPIWSILGTEESASTQQITSCLNSFGGSLFLVRGGLNSWAWHPSSAVLPMTYPDSSPPLSLCTLGTARGDHLLHLFCRVGKSLDRCRVTPSCLCRCGVSARKVLPPRRHPAYSCLSFSTHISSLV